MIAALKNIFTGPLHLFYPHVCTGCGSDLIREDNQLCFRCIYNLPHTNFEGMANNPIEKFFWGRLPLKSGHSEFYFSKEFLVQHLIHQLKYRGNTNIGLYLGEMMGNRLLKSNRFNGIDALIPLPLYAEKERWRGYNQAAIICNGISSVMNIPVLIGAVIRHHPTESQTRKHRTERWENVKESFKVLKESELKNKHLLLVDDVVTTGATLEACGNRLLEVENVRLSVATLAWSAK